MQIKPYPKNAKKHPDKQLELLAKVVSEVGWRQNTEVNQDGVIVAGHGRYMAWEKYKDKYNLPPIWITNDKGETIHGEHATMPLTEEQEKMWRLADNQLNAMTDMDMELVIEELKELSEPMVELTGFDTDLLIEPDEKDDEVPEVPEEPQSKLGDLYELGDHRVLCGDSTKLEDVERLMDGKKADMVFTSPPYNANTKAGDGDIFTSKKSKKLYAEGYLDNLPPDEYVKFAQDVLSICFAVTEGFIFWNVSYNKNSRYQYIQQITPFLEHLIEQIAWKKSSAIPFKGSMRRAWEPIYLFSTQKVTLGLDKVETNVWEVSNTDSQAENHKACYPVALVEKGISIINGAKNILDPFLGSGSTLIASEKTGRICYGMELDPKYVDVIVQRYVDYTGNTEVIKNGEKITWQKRK